MMEKIIDIIFTVFVVITLISSFFIIIVWIIPFIPVCLCLKALFSSDTGIVLKFLEILGIIAAWYLSIYLIGEIGNEMDRDNKNMV